MAEMNRNQVGIIEEALLTASYYISDSIEAICDEDYLQTTESVLMQVNNALELIRNLSD